MKTWLKLELQFHYESMVELFAEYGTHPFDLEALIYESMEYSDLDEGFFKDFPYLRKVKMTTETAPMSLADAVTMLNVSKMSEEDINRTVWRTYSKYHDKVFRLQDGVIYADTVENLYQFTEEPTWEKTIQPWDK